MPSKLPYFHTAHSTEPLPSMYRGIWRRQQLITAEGKDDTSLVLWLQTEYLHGDIRLPAVRPRFEEAWLTGMAEKQLRWLALQQGFAGLTAVKGDVCQWHRHIDYQPANGKREIGRMRFEGRDKLIETGVDAEYLEVWERLPGSSDRTASLETTVKLPDGQEVSAYWLVAGNWFMFIRDRSVFLPASPDLQTAIRKHRPDRTSLVAWLDLEISFGRVQPNGSGLIQHSTLPFREGRAVSLPF